MSKRPQKRDEVSFLFCRQTHAEARVVKLNGFVQVFRQAVVEIRGTRSKSTQNRAFEARDVFPLAA